MTVLETSRLRIRFLEPGDAEFILRLVNEPSFLANIGDRGIRSVEQAGRYLEEGPLNSYARHGHGLYLVESRESGESMGMCGLLRRDQFQDIDLGYALLPEFWARGYAHEAAAAVLHFGHTTIGAPRILGLVRPDNVPSIRVLEKLGFTFTELRQIGNTDAPPTAIYAHVSEA